MFSVCLDSHLRGNDFLRLALLRGFVNLDAVIGGAVSDHLVDQAVLFCLFRGHDVVAVGVLGDFGEALPRGFSEDAVQLVAGLEDFTGVDVDVRRLSLHSAHRLMDDDLAVWQRRALPFGSRSEQQRCHRGGVTDGDGGDVRLDVLHRVVDRHSAGHQPTRAVDVERDVFIGVFRFEEDQLGDHQRRDVVVDPTGDEDNPFTKQTRVNVVGAFAATRLLNDHWYEVHISSEVRKFESYKGTTRDDRSPYLSTPYQKETI